MRTPEIRFNGCGFAFLGIKQDAGKQKGTYWFTFLYLPIVPITRATIAYPQQRVVVASEHERPRAGEVLRTYLFGWVLFPTLLLGPLALGIGLYQTFKTVGLVAMAVGVIWFCVLVWKLADWHEQRRHIK